MALMLPSQPTLDLPFHDLLLFPIFLPRLANYDFSPPPRRFQGRERSGKKRFLIEQSGAHFEIFKPGELCPGQSPAELPFENRTVRFAHPEGQKCANISKYGITNTFIQLPHVLMREDERQPVFSGFRENAGKRVRRIMMKFIRKQEEIFALIYRAVGP